MGKGRKKQIGLFEAPTSDTSEVFLPELWAQDVRAAFTKTIAWDMAKKMDEDIFKAIVEPEKTEVTVEDIGIAARVLDNNDAMRITATELAMRAEQQRQADFRDAIVAAQRRQTMETQDALMRRGLSPDYLKQMMGPGIGGLNKEEFFRRYAQALGEEKVLKNRATYPSTEEEMRGILSEITAADLIIKFMNSGYNDFKGWLRTYINEQLDEYREKQATKTEAGGADPITEDTPRTILSGN